MTPRRSHPLLTLLGVLLLALNGRDALPATLETTFLGEQIDLNNPQPGLKKPFSPEVWTETSVESFDDEVEHIVPRVVPVPGEGISTRRSRVSTRPTWTLAQRAGPDPSDEAGAPAPSSPTASIDEAFCDFGPLPVQSLCEWQDGCGGLKWAPGTGLATNWLGGPPTDTTAGTMEGGYAFVETSQTPVKPSASTSTGAAEVISPSGLLHSPQLGSTGVLGTCFTFRYAMDGLSSSGLRVLLHAGVDEFSLTALKANLSTPLTASCERPFPANAAAQLQQEERILWSAHYHVLGTWQYAQILYTYPDLHTLIIEGIPVDASDPSRSYRGYIAVDDIDLQPPSGTSCVGFCNFAGGFCEWTNEAEDDFDWRISRGSSNPTTGPAMDRDASLSSGGYAYIDSSHPRRPGDVARLVSASLPASATDAPMCMHFSFHMFGSGIGELKLSLRHTRSLEAQTQEIWRLKGNAGNSWFDSRVTVSSLDDFQLIIEASVGNTAMGDIAIDDIAFTTGPCPTSPQVAAPTHFPRDCTFEIDECEWINSREPGASPVSPAGLPSRGRVDWQRVSQQTLNPRNQRKPYSLPATRPRQEYFMALQTRGVAPAVTGTAYLLGNEIKPTSDPLCLTFWYLMFESFIDATGPSLGVLRVLIQPVGESIDAARPVWQLYNNQGPTWNYAQASIIERRDFHVVFEGTWGPNRANGNIAIDDIAFYTGNCTDFLKKNLEPILDETSRYVFIIFDQSIFAQSLSEIQSPQIVASPLRPPGAIVSAEDCSFEKGLCGWENMTGGGVSDPRLQWQRAYPNHRPAQLLDKTFGSSGDFVFFDIFSPNQKREVKLRSPLIAVQPDDELTCFSFWFVAFGVEESTSLRIIKMSAGQKANGSPESSQGDEESDQQLLWTLTAKGFNNPRPSWTWAQVTIEDRSPYRLVLEGNASNGGFAIDDVKFQPQACPTRPTAARPGTAGSQEL